MTDRKLVDVHFPRAKRITLVMDNLNTHSLGSLYEAFPPQAAGAAPELAHGGG